METLKSSLPSEEKGWAQSVWRAQAQPILNTMDLEVTK